MREPERDYNGDIIRYCSECEWCKSLEGSDDETYYFCMDVDGDAFLEITGLLCWCTIESESE
ncbi:hypothetical protein [Anaerotruncus colihominis]|uniref:hypothetical protein n=1 Tax=Anaerotruncus colihominis TaxID=169435 RepID=UPI0035168BDD